MSPMKKYITFAALTAALATPVAAQGVVSAPAPLLVPMTSEGFRAMAPQSDSFEIQSSQLARQRSRNPAVRSFAQRMIRDHSMTSQALSRCGQAGQRMRAVIPSFDRIWDWDHGGQIPC